MNAPDFGLTAAIVTIGDEVVEGRVGNDNARWLAERLMQADLWPRLVVAVPDETAAIARMLTVAADAADIVIVSGGLGFTPDDITRTAVAEAFERGIVVDVGLAAVIRNTCAWASDETATAVATFPVGAVPIPSTCGGVPGFTLKNVHVLPGSPREMRAMFEFLPLPPPRTRHRIVSHVSSWPATEDAVLDILSEFDGRHPEVRIGSYPGDDASQPGVRVVLASRSLSSLARAVAWLGSRMSERLASDARE